jgi:hypothetical protein
VLVTDGGFLPDGTFRPLAWFDSRHVERLFRAEVLRMLLDKELVQFLVPDRPDSCLNSQRRSAGDRDR